jgi:hypothetical protein
MAKFIIPLTMVTGMGAKQGITVTIEVMLTEETLIKDLMAAVGKAGK